MPNEMVQISERVLDSGLVISYVKQHAMSELNPQNYEDFWKIANACRLNALAMIKVAGSGHVGSSFSAVDLILGSRLFLLKHLSGNQNPGIFFSSKGHDTPGLYAVMHYFNEISDEQLFTLRKFKGLPGHPEITVPGIPTNTGSLGMGISKAKGFVYANRLLHKNRTKVVTLLGDGELQEGQIWESLNSASRDAMGELTVLIDGNKIQSDSWVESTSSNGDLAKKFEGAGWQYSEIDGHNFENLRSLEKLDRVKNKPLAIYCHTKKSSGVGFMEDFSRDGKFYKFHSGSPSDAHYAGAVTELINRIQYSLESGKRLETNVGHVVVASDQLPKERNQSFIQSWNEMLIDWFGKRSDLVALDADLAYDTGTYGVAEKFPDRYIQCGIAEQDMVSIAGTLALSGLLPIVGSFASFLTMRATEQIFNNATEESKIIYCGFLAGLLPSAPGHSHQAVSDVGVIGSIPNIEVIEPSCSTELALALASAINSNLSTYFRIGSVDFPQPLNFDNEIELHSLNLRKIGSRFALITSGPSMCNIAEQVAEISNGSVAVFTYPCIQRGLTHDMILKLSKFEKIIVLENYLPAVAMFHNIRNSLIENEIPIPVKRIGIDSVPANGDTPSVLNFHKLTPSQILHEFGA